MIKQKAIGLLNETFDNFMEKDKLPPELNELKGYKLFKEAIKVLQGKEPKESKDCGFCKLMNFSQNFSKIFHISIYMQTLRINVQESI